MTTLALARSKSISLQLPSINWKIVCICAAVLALIVSIFYIYLVNELTRGTYLVRDYQAQIKALSDAKGNLEVELARTNFWAEVRQRASSMDFMAVKEVKYTAFK